MIEDREKAVMAKAVMADEVQVEKVKSGYPAVFASSLGERSKRKLGDYFGLTNFGVNLTTLKDGAQTALLHSHLAADELVYLLEGELVLVCKDAGGKVTETVMTRGMCAGFPKQGDAHHIKNLSGQDAVILEIGDRVRGDAGSYPDDDLVAQQDGNGKWVFLHKNGEPY